MLSAVLHASRARRFLPWALLLVGLTWPGLAFAGTAVNDYRANLLAASGVPGEHIAACCARLDAGGREIQALPVRSEAELAEAIHAYIHRTMLTGKYRASASQLGQALDGGPFNCVVGTALFLDLARQCGLPAQAVSVPGHVWCRVPTEAGPINIETTCVNWFDIIERDRNLPDEQVSQAMRVHRQRQAQGRVLDSGQLLAIFHFNRGVTLWRERQFAGAAWANLRAVCFDPECRVAWENLLASAKAAFGHEFAFFDTRAISN